MVLSNDYRAEFPESVLKTKELLQELVKSSPIDEDTQEKDYTIDEIKEIELKERMRQIAPQID